MAQGVLHRAGVAIVLIATLLAPYARCQAQAGTHGHACCGQPAPTATVGTNCCIVRAQLPAVVIERAAPVSHRILSAAFVVASGKPLVRFEATARTEVTHYPSPPGVSILRI